MNNFVLEHCEYKDDGCDLFPSCLHCPLTKCRYDQPGKHTSKRLRNRDMMCLYKEGVGIGELAQRFAVSTRTVYRVIATHNGETATLPSSASRTEET